MKKTILFLALAAMLASCCNQKTGKPELFAAEAFDTLYQGKPVSLYTLTNEAGMAVQITNYGARIVDLWVPSADGSFQDVVMGFENIKSYLEASDIYNGPVVGRFGNRIGKGQFTLDDKQYNLTINNGENHLHGGVNGFSDRVWDVASVVGTNEVTMSYRSVDGEEGYPGNLDLKVIYSLTPDNKLLIIYSAITDAPTIVNPTSHCYFNLHGTNEFSTNSHVLQIFGNAYTPTDAGLIPTGEIALVDGTPLDFTSPTPIGERIDSDFEAIKFGGGYDHNWILEKDGLPGDLELAARVLEPSTGILMEVTTDQPGIQFYSGNFMKGTEKGKRGNVNTYRSGIALETQNFPDAPNHVNFPSAVLRPGETYTHTCIYAFTVVK